MAALGAGQRDRKVVLQQRTVVRGELGVEPGEGWTDIFTEWASVRYGSSAERRNAASEGATQAATFGVLWNSRTRALTPGHRLMMEGQAWDIQGVSISPGNTGVVLAATVARG